MDITAPDKIRLIRELNDHARQSFTGCAVILTVGVDALCPEVKAEVLRRVRAFNGFGAWT